MRAHFADILRNVLERLHRRRPDLHRRHRGSACDHDVEPHDVREAVVQRQYDERPERRRNVDARKRLLDVGRVVAVRQHDALGIGRGARRVGDRRIVVVPDPPSDGEELLAVLRQVVAAQPAERSQCGFARLQRYVAYDDDMLDFGQLGAYAADFRQLVFRYEQRLHFGVAHAEQQVVRLFELDRQRHADRPGVEHAQLRDDPCVGPFGQYGDFVLGANPDRGQPGPGLQGQLLGLGVGRRLERPVFLLQQECLGTVFLHGAFEQVDDGLLHGRFV